MFKTGCLIDPVMVDKWFELGHFDVIHRTGAPRIPKQIIAHMSVNHWDVLYKHKHNLGRKDKNDRQKNEYTIGGNVISINQDKTNQDAHHDRAARSIQYKMKNDARYSGQVIRISRQRITVGTETKHYTEWANQLGYPLT